jgi:hypothetical protein
MYEMYWSRARVSSTTSNDSDTDDYTSLLGQGGVTLLFKILEEGVNFRLTIVSRIAKYGVVT